MKNEVKHEGRFFYSYREYLLARLISLPCCCCVKRCTSYERRMKRFESYEAASKTLDAELDINRIINAVRLTEFMSMLSLKRY